MVADERERGEQGQRQNSQRARHRAGAPSDSPGMVGPCRPLRNLARHGSSPPLDRTPIRTMYSTCSYTATRRTAPAMVRELVRIGVAPAGPGGIPAAGGFAWAREQQGVEADRWRAHARHPLHGAGACPFPGCAAACDHACPVESEVFPGRDPARPRRGAGKAIRSAGCGASERAARQPQDRRKRAGEARPAGQACPEGNRARVGPAGSGTSPGLSPGDRANGISASVAPCRPSASTRAAQGFPAGRGRERPRSARAGSSDRARHPARGGAGHDPRRRPGDRFRPDDGRSAGGGARAGRAGNLSSRDHLERGCADREPVGRIGAARPLARAHDAGVRGRRQDRGRAAEGAKRALSVRQADRAHHRLRHRQGRGRDLGERRAGGGQPRRRRRHASHRDAGGGHHRQAAQRHAPAHRHGAQPGRCRKRATDCPAGHRRHGAGAECAEARDPAAGEPTREDRRGEPERGARDRLQLQNRRRHWRTDPGGGAGPGRRGRQRSFELHPLGRRHHAGAGRQAAGSRHPPGDRPGRDERHGDVARRAEPDGAVGRDGELPRRRRDPDPAKPGAGLGLGRVQAIWREPRLHPPR